MRKWEDPSVVNLSVTKFSKWVTKKDLPEWFYFIAQYRVYVKQYIDKVWFNWGFLIKILSSIKSRLYRWSLHTTHHPPPRKLSFANSQPPVVRFEHVRTIFDSTQSQESKSEVSLHKITRQCALRPILCPLLFLSSLWSNLSMWGHFLIVLNLRNPNLRSACAKEHGNAPYWPFYVLCCFSAPCGLIWVCEDTFW